MDLRKANEIRLLEVSPLDEILGSKLPTNMVVFRHCFWRNRVDGEKLAVALRSTVKVAISFWERMGFKTKGIKVGIRDLSSLLDEHKVDVLKHQSNRI